MRTTSGRRVGAACVLALLAAAAGAQADPSVAVSRAEGRLLHRRVPDVPLHLADGRTVPLSSLWQDKPLLVTFFYRNCHGICSPFLAWIRNAVREDDGLGRNYRILALSFGEQDTVADMRSQGEALGIDDPDWLFAIADREALARVIEALEFWYRPDPATGQYDHTALLVAVEDGRVKRALVGGAGFAERFPVMARELRGEFIRSYAVPAQTAWRCFSFDPVTGRVSVDWGLLILQTAWRCFSFDPVTGRVSVDWGLLILGLPTLTAMTVTFGIFRRGPRRR
ncbi:MAG: SCO family protein [Acidobacteria bacterium]|nr:SCO family protein [Acidobacteriota bacterium]